jgi:FdhD protein
MATTARPGAETRTKIVSYDGGQLTERSDSIATEEPLEIRVSIAGQSKTVAVTMRTPGADFELAAGFLFGEGVITTRGQVTQISYCKDTDLPADQLYNIVIVELDPRMQPDLRPLDRHFYTSSACGVCGKANLEAIAIRGVQPAAPTQPVPAAVVSSLPDVLRASQKIFAKTGGLHSAGLFTLGGELLASREDVGRHNAMDKLIGSTVLEGTLPLSDRIVMVSGRSSYELAQKCVTAGVPILCSVSAPSSLAIDVAREFGLTLIGFVRGNSFNVYAGAERVS